jgi:hypothetical protein
MSGAIMELANKIVFIYAMGFGVMLTFWTDKMASGYGAAVATDVKVFMAFMGIENLVVAMMTKGMMRVNNDKTSAMTALANGILYTIFFLDSVIRGPAFFRDGGMPTTGLYFNIFCNLVLGLLSLYGWFTAGKPMPTIGKYSKIPSMTAFNAINLIFGVLMVFAQDMMFEAYMTDANGVRATPMGSNSMHFMTEMMKYMGYFKIFASVRAVFIMGCDVPYADYTLTRMGMIISTMWAAVYTFMPYIASACNWPFTFQTQMSNFILGFGLMYWTVNWVVRHGMDSKMKKITTLH